MGIALYFICVFVLFQYDPRFGDAFWNSSKFGMVNYLLRMMSSWAIVCSVWYLPPMSRQVRPARTQTHHLCKCSKISVVWMTCIALPIFALVHLIHKSSTNEPEWVWTSVWSFVHPPQIGNRHLFLHVGRQINKYTIVFNACVGSQLSKIPEMVTIGKSLCWFDPSHLECCRSSLENHWNNVEALPWCTYRLF